jgi:hypothetical protein
MELKKSTKRVPKLPLVMGNVCAQVDVNVPDEIGE